MGKVIVFASPRQVEIAYEEDRPLKLDEVRVQTKYSGISAGTELSAYRGSNPYLHKRWEPETRLFVPSPEPSQVYPLVGWGYEECGEVIEAGGAVSRLKLGDLVYGAWGHRTHAVLAEEYAAARLLPPALEPLLGVFSHIGSIALNGILDAGLHIGETVSVFGLGVPGQIVAQLAHHSGTRVIGIDLLPSRLDLALRLGAIELAIHPGDGSPAEKIKSLTGGRGADVTFEVSGSTAALNEAIRATAYSSRVVSLGFFQGESSGLYLGDEFHHNRITLVCSQISNVNPALGYRWDRLRLAHTIMDLQVRGILNLKPLVTQVVPLSQAAEAFRILDESPETAMQVVFEMEQKG